ncbi:MAG: iron ABC transporter permease [Deltaproteobacteria bacterium]|nr:iron ABC transporter permease [Deltaproteobacteria bacterium]
MMTGRILAPKLLRDAWGKLHNHLHFAFVVIVVTWLVIIPLLNLIVFSFRMGHPTSPGPWTLAKYIGIFSSAVLWNALLNTGIIAGCGTLISIGCAAFFAYLVERTDLPWREMLWTLIVLPMAIPGILFAMSWILLLSPKIGLANIVLRHAASLFGIELSDGPLNIYTVGGLIFLDGLRGVPTAFLLIVGSMRMMDPALEEAAEASGLSKSKTFFLVTAPLLWPAVFGAALYSFISSLESFEGALAIGLPANIFMLSTLIYFQARMIAPTDYGATAAYGVIFVLVMLGFVWWYLKILRRKEMFAVITGRGFRPRIHGLGRWRYPIFGIFVIYLILTVLAPTLVLLWASLLPIYKVPSLEALGRLTVANYHALVTGARFWPVVWNTVVVSIATSGITMICALLVSWVVVRTRLRFRFALDGLMYVSYAVPTIVIALALAMMYLQVPFKYVPVYGTVWIIVVGLVVHYLAFATRLTNSAVIQVHRELEEAAHTSGIRPGGTLLWVTVPLIAPAMVAGSLWVFTHASRAFSIPLMLASRRNEVLAVTMWNYWDNGDVGLTAALGMILIVTLAFITFGGRRIIPRAFEAGTASIKGQRS